MPQSKVGPKCFSDHIVLIQITAVSPWGDGLVGAKQLVPSSSCVSPVCEVPLFPHTEFFFLLSSSCFDMQTQVTTYSGMASY